MGICPLPMLPKLRAGQPGHGQVQPRPLVGGRGFQAGPDPWSNHGPISLRRGLQLAALGRGRYRRGQSCTAGTPPRFLQPLRHPPHSALDAVEAVLDVVRRRRLLLRPGRLGGRRAAIAPDGLDVCSVHRRRLHHLDGPGHAHVALAEAHRLVQVQRVDKTMPTRTRRQLQRFNHLGAPLEAREADHVSVGAAVGLRQLRDEQIEQVHGCGKVVAHDQNSERRELLRLHDLALLLVRGVHEDVHHGERAVPHGVPPVRVDFQRRSRGGEGEEDGQKAEEEEGHLGEEPIEHQVEGGDAGGENAQIRGRHGQQHGAEHGWDRVHMSDSVALVAMRRQERALAEATDDGVEGDHDEEDHGQQVALAVRPVGSRERHAAHTRHLAHAIIRPRQSHVEDAVRGQEDGVDEAAAEGDDDPHRRALRVRLGDDLSVQDRLRERVED
mmetsp:Transcript_70223/g.203612  ORF Transcript_70223/g.203612 Transcript_70223/m.203612 type:complete len:440 (-) Transcript_70223:1265-2584(-)